MDSRFLNLKLWLAVALATAVSSVQAQTEPGQSIIFSTPDDASNTPSLTAQPPDEAGIADTIHAPDFNFKNVPKLNPRLPIPPPPAIISQAEADRRANWALMTPAEILGVATPEQILKIPERDAAGQLKNPTSAERFLERQNQAQTNGGGIFPDTSLLRRDFLDNEGLRLKPGDFNPGTGGFWSQPQKVGPFQKPAQGNNSGTAQNDDTGWSKNFISSETSPAQGSARDANMAEFRKLLETSRLQKSSKPSPDDGFFSPQQTAPDSVSGLPANHSGLFDNKIGGLPPAIGQSVLPRTTAAPAWKPQPPPWLQQPGIIQQ